MAITKLFFILILVTAYEASGRKDVSEPVKTDKLRQEVLNKIDEIREDTGHPEWQYLARKKPGGLDGQLVLEFKSISEKIDKIKLPKLSERIMETLWVWSVLNIEMSTINGKWEVFRQSQARPDPIMYGAAWKDITEITLHDSPSSSSVKNSLASLQDMILDNVQGHKDVFTIVNEEADEHMCEAEMSPQQLLYNLFSILQMSQLKAYTMINFSWLLLRIYNKGNFTTEAKMLHDNYLERMSQQANALKESMKRADSSYWKCDPRIHEEGKTYTEVTKVLQGFLVNEVDLNKEVTCREDCPFYKYTKQYTCYKDNYCAKQPRCNGNVVGCEFVDSDMWVCQAPSSSTRRYDWIRYENGRTLGSMGSCSRSIAKVDSWWRWLFWHCSFCICYCDDPTSHQSDRYFNLRAVISDKANNKVVTGIRFTKVNRIIHLQVQEGELLPMGGINETTIQWKPVDDYNIDDKGVTVGVDYHMLTWEGRAIDLDDIKVPQDCVVTGVKLRRVGGHLNLEVEGAQFNFTTGKLIQSGEKSFWSSNDKTDVSSVNPRTQLKLKRPDIPTKSAGASHIDSKSEQFIEFGPTDLDLDAGQTTIPFLDTQLVAPQPPVPLTGIGIYHKGRDYSGGFIAPKVFTYDFSQHITDHFPEINEAL